jgi:hypothetical protein
LWPRVEQCREQPTLDVEVRVTDRIDARMESMKATRRDPTPDCGVGEPAFTELSPAHHASLACR